MMTYPRIRFRVSILCAAICITALASAQSTQPASKFLRFVPDDHDGGVLQTSVVTYRNSAGVTVDLIAAIHIAQADYFHELDKSFEQYDALLYEMVKPADFNPPANFKPSTRPANLSRPMGWVGMLQHFLKNSLGLAFQLDEINYARPNFVHADMDVDTFLQRQEDRGESIFSLMLQQMLRELSRDDPGYQPGLGDILLAMQSPDRNRQIKLMLAREFDHMEDMLAGLDGPDGSVIVGERNEAALKVLREQIAKGKKKLGIFYGAGHLKGMEKILTTDMGFKQVGDPKWRVAWDMTAKEPATQPAQP
jgi:hypothetical protein